MPRVTFTPASSSFKVSFNGTSDNITLKNQIASGSRLDSLIDVDTSVSQANGSILVYDVNTDTYVQRAILTFDVESGAFNLEGGSF